MPKEIIISYKPGPNFDPVKATLNGWPTPLKLVSYFLIKLLVNVRFANIINIINNKEVIPELLQKECNAEEIYKTVTYFLKNPKLIEKQLAECEKTLEGIKSKSSSSSEVALILNNYLIL